MTIGSRTASPRRWRAESPATVGMLLAAPAVLLVVGLVGYPLVALTVDSLGTEGREAIGQVFTADADRAALLRTIRVSLIVTVLALLLGGALAWSLRSAVSRWWRLLLWTAVLAPFWMSVVVKNYALILILRRGGPLHELLANVGLASADDDLLYSEGAVIIGMLYAMLPYAVLSLYAAFAALDTTLLGAAEVLGASRVRALIGIALPLCARGILAAGTLVFVVCLGFYVTPVVLGGPAAPFVASVVGSSIFDYFDLVGARAFAFVLLLIAIAAVALNQTVGRFLPSADGHSGDRP